MEYLITWVSKDLGNRRDSTFSRVWAFKLAERLADQGLEFTFQTIDHRK